MRKLVLHCFITIIMIVVSSCQYDDTDVINRVSALEERVYAVEALLKASANNLTIISVTETDNGFVVTFSDDSTININKTETNNIINSILFNPPGFAIDLSVEEQNTLVSITHACFNDSALNINNPKLTIIHVLII